MASFLFPFLLLFLSFTSIDSLLRSSGSSVCRTSSRTLGSYRIYDKSPLEGLEANADGTFSDRKDVKDVLAKLMAALAPSSPSAAGTATEDEITVQTVQATFDKILANVRSSDLTPMEKSMLMTEASMLLDDVKQQGNMENIAGSGLTSKQALGVYQPRTKIYSESSAPWVLVYGPGLIGQATLAKLKSLGKAVDLKLIDANSLTTMQDSELNYAVRDVKTIVIAADSTPSKEGWTPLLTDKSLKRLLNAAMNDRNRRGSTQDNNIKVVAVAKATKQPKSLASIFGGETTEFDSEVILQCKSRQLGYTVVKVGTIINDDAPIPSGLRDRALKDIFGTSKLSKEEEAAGQPLYQNPVIFTSSRVEQAEVTRLSVAVDALLRSTSTPFNNATISVLSQPAETSSALPTDEQWDDEFLKLDGPELLRFPLRFASVTQVAIKLGRIVQELKDPKSGLITPIEVERYSNGARIIFRPKESSYVSSKEEKKTKEVEDVVKIPAPVKKSGYMSPEQEAKMEREMQMASSGTASTTASAPTKNKKAQPLEGGLDVIVETVPYRRVRIKRCLMGPTTVVKEESEAILLKALTRGIVTLENDYRIMMMAGMKT